MVINPLSVFEVEILAAVLKHGPGVRPAVILEAVVGAGGARPGLSNLLVTLDRLYRKHQLDWPAATPDAGRGDRLYAATDEGRKRYGLYLSALGFDDGARARRIYRDDRPD